MTHDTAKQGIGTRPQHLRVITSEPVAASAYVERDGASLQQFVNRYIRTRHRPVNRENRLAVQEGIAMYERPFPARSAELERFLDSLLLASAAEA